MSQWPGDFTSMANGYSITRHQHWLTRRWTATVWRHDVALPPERQFKSRAYWNKYTVLDDAHLWLRAHEAELYLKRCVDHCPFTPNQTDSIHVLLNVKAARPECVEWEVIEQWAGGCYTAVRDGEIRACKTGSGVYLAYKVHKTCTKEQEDVQATITKDGRLMT